MAEVVAVTKRLIDIDDELLAAAQQAAGQDSIKGTVTEALNRLVAQQRRREQYLRDSWAQLGDAMVDLQDDEVMHRAWS
jgi:Arc/MetJ family transcription regulator